MKHRILRNSLVIGLIAVALIAGAFQLETRWQQPDTVRAQTDDDDDDLSGGALAVLLLAVGSGQTTRLSVGTAPGGREVPYLWFFTMHNTRNEVIYRSERIEVPAGEWRFAEVPPGAFTNLGDPAQVKVQVFVDVPPGRKPSDFSGSVVLYNPATGETTTNVSFAFR